MRGEEGARETASSGPPRGASPAAGVTCCVSINSFFKERDTLPQQEVVAGLPQPRAASGGESGAPGGSAQGAEKPRSPAASRLRRAARMGPWPARRAVAGAEGSGRRGGRRGPHPLARGDPPASPARPRGGRGRAGVAGRRAPWPGAGPPASRVFYRTADPPRSGAERRPFLPVDLRPRATLCGHQGSHLHSLSQSERHPKLRATPEGGLSGMHQDSADRVGDMTSSWGLCRTGPWGSCRGRSTES